MEFSSKIAKMIKDWIDRISEPRSEIGGFAVCPFARKAEYTIIETDGSDINPPPWDFELIVYKLPNNYTIDELTDIATEYNILYPEMIFLPDHKDKDTYINGVQTNNSKYNLILCQWRDNLEKSRKKLMNTSYYSFWDDNYLKEILNQ
jgi:hypothetical protein